MEQEIKEIFNESRTTTASHQKLTLALHNIYSKADFNAFSDVITREILPHILTLEYKIANKDAEKAIGFFTSFLCFVKVKNKQGENDLLKAVFDHLLMVQTLDNHVYRYRSCEVIGCLFDKLAEHSIDDEFLEEVQDALLDRASDPKTDVRLQALSALYRLQNLNEPKNPVIQEYISSLYDRNAKVRKLVVEKIAIRRDVIDHIVSRIRDVDFRVRLAAFTRLSKLVKALKIVQRQTVLKAGSLEDNAKVKQYVATKMVSLWFEQYDCDCLQLIKAVRLDADEKDVAETAKVAEFALKCIFKTHSLKEILQSLPLDAEKCSIAFEDLNWETVILWRVLSQYLRQRDDFEEILGVILPDLVNFCEYIKNYSQKPITTDNLEQQFILQQLLCIASEYDIADVVARKTLTQSTNFLLQTANLSAAVVNVAMQILEKCMPNVHERCRYVSEIIAEIMCPISAEETANQTQDEIAEIKSRFETLREAKMQCEKSEDYLQAADYQKQLDDLKVLLKDTEAKLLAPKEVKQKRDPATIKKYLDVAAALLHSPQITALTNTLIALKEQVIQECLIHPDENINATALKCYVLCCLVDRATAKNGLHICALPIIDYHLGNPCQVPILTVAISGVVDMLLIYGFDLLAEPERDENLSESMSEQNRAPFAGGTSLTTLIQGLAELMSDENLEVAVLAVKGLCMLVSYSGLESPSLISRLILKWAHPDTETSEESEIRARIGHTLNHLVLDPLGSQQLQQAILPTIRALIRAPKTSPLHKVQGNVIKFLIALCRTAVNNLEIQTKLAVSICDLMRKDPASSFNLAYSEALLLLELPYNDSVISDLLDDCDAILDAVGNKKVCNCIRKFVAKLQKIIPENKEVKKEEESDNVDEEESESSSLEEEESENE